MGRKVEQRDEFWKWPFSDEETETQAEETESREGETEAMEETEGIRETDALWETEAAQGTEAIRETEADGAGSFGADAPWLWFAGSGLLLILGALIFILAFRKQRRQPEKEQRESVDPLSPVSVTSAGTLHHIGEREEQQDSFVLSDFAAPRGGETGCLAVVADGMGGMKNGGRISAMVTASLLGKFEREGIAAGADIPMALLGWAQEANEEVLRDLGSHVGESGSTLVTAWVKNSRLYYLSVGDSRICLLRDGALTVLNREHVYGSELDERAARGEISLEAARSDPQRHALTSYIGCSPLQKIDRSLYGFPLLSGDKILLMSDGVFGTLSDGEILAEAGKEAPVMAEALLERILSRRKPEQDNFTAVILQCG